MELSFRPDREDLTLLYDAAIRGCITTLNDLIQKDKLILNKVSLSNFTETPLHISSLAGHIDFTIAVLQRCSKLATESDSLKRLPIHLASAQGHTEIVKALLRVNKDVCLARDEDGRIPLHLAAMRGRVEVIQELASACPDSISELLDGDSVFHLCVKFNHSEALKLLVDVVDDADIIYNKGNQDGNTLLHLAAMLKELEIMRYLLSLTKAREGVNAFNNMEFTALDLVDQCSMDIKSVKIRDILSETGAKRAIELRPSSAVAVSVTPASTTSINFNSKSERKSCLKKSMKFLEYDREETQGALMIVATVIATMTFQAAINPPGGVWQQNVTDKIIGAACTETEICEAGTSVLAYAYPDQYKYFLVINSIAFFLSLCVIALVVGGFPLRNKFCVWLLAQAIGVTLVFLGVSYVSGTLMVIPARFRVKMAKLDQKIIYVWAGINLVAALIDMVRFC